MSNYKLKRTAPNTSVHKALDHENDIIKQWAKEDWEVGKPFSPDDFDYFRRLASEDGYEVDENDFAKYFEYYDEFRDAQFKDDGSCVLCGHPIEGYGNNPYPLSNTGEACDKCNMEKVIPARLENLRK